MLQQQDSRRTSQLEEARGEYYALIGAGREAARQQSRHGRTPWEVDGVEHERFQDGARTWETAPDLGPCRLLAEQMRDVLLLVDPADGRILEVNPAAVSSYGYSREMLLAMRIGDLRVREERSSILDQLDRANREGLLFETIHVRADASQFPVEVSARGADIGGRRVVVSLVRDISQRRASEERLRRSHDTFYNLIQNAPFGVYVVDSQFRLAQVSAGSLRVFQGVRPLIGRDFAEVLRTIWPEPFASAAIERFRHTLKTGEPFHSPATVERRADVDDEEAYDWRLERIALPDGEFGVVCYFYDLSERRRYEAALRESQERQRIAVESAQLGMFEWRIADDVAVWENDRPYEIFGRERRLGPVGRDEFVRDFLVPEDRAMFLQQSGPEIRDNDRASWTLRIRRPDGQIRWVEITGTIAARDESGPLRMLGVVRDVTETRTAELAVRESEERFRSMANAMPQLVWIADNQGTVTYYNSQAAKYSGLVQNASGTWSWEPLVHSEDIESTSRAWNTAVSTGRTYECEHRIKMADGTYRWHLSRAFRSADGAQWFGTATDVHELKQTEDALRSSQRELARHRDELERRVDERTRELTATHDRLRLSERFAMMGTLAAGLGHDLGNLLVPVRVRLESLSHATLDPQSREDVESIKTAAEYLRRLAQGLRLLSLDPDRASRGEVADIAAWWSDVQGVLKSALPRGIEVVSQIDDGIGAAQISRPALTQVVFNLFQNAGDAMRERGSGVIRISSRRVDQSIHVCIEDNGPGMTDQVRERCMEPFFTTKSRGISTGLGLVLVYGLIRDAGGRVELESQVDRGTRFNLVLPAAPLTQSQARPRCQCIIDIKDPRVRSIVGSELGALNVEAITWDLRDGQEKAAILDDPAKAQNLSQDTFGLLLATTSNPAPNLRVLGDRPNISDIRDAIRTIIGDATLDTP